MRTADNITELPISNSSARPAACVLLEEDSDKVSEKGWALAQQKSKSKFSDRQKAYLTKKFEEGERSGKKLKADEVAQDMRRVRDEVGRRVFTIEEFLTSKQVASFFSRLAAKKRSVTTSDNEAIEAEEIRKETHGPMIRALDSHPLICEDVVLCEMSREKLHRFKLDKLKAICSHFGIDTQFSKKKNSLRGQAVRVHAKLRMQNLGLVVDHTRLV
ncbi:hypothetical protein P5673_026111 [Acropora cervicornis]|uniref:Uncharacterized protein n=1 Tax=Acropora cervicornis TaxID=6130 RepID=A0AAD9Q0W2_ACRCE|nr:hypothetical protein P5673_026111 [Acropora cervicornis]